MVSTDGRQQGRRIAICGTSPRTRPHVEAAIKDASMEIWALNDMYTWDPPIRWDVFFDLHAPIVYRTQGRWDWIKAQPPGKPIYVLVDEPEAPAAVVYPLADVRALAPDPERPLLTSSIGMEIALACLQHSQGRTIAELHLLGADFVSSVDYETQRAGVQAWLFIARGMGMKIVYPEESETFKGTLYGYESRYQAVTSSMLNEHYSNLLDEEIKVLQQLSAIRGARTLIEGLLRRINVDELGLPFPAQMDRRPDIPGLHHKAPKGTQPVHLIDDMAGTVIEQAIAKRERVGHPGGVVDGSRP